MKFLDYVKTREFKVGALIRGHRIKGHKITKRVDGLLRAIEEGTTEEYHDKQDQIKERRRKRGTHL